MFILIKTTFSRFVGIIKYKHLRYIHERVGGDFKMAHINVTTTQEERDKVLKVLKELNGEIVPVSKIANKAHIKQSRARYVILDLIDAGLIERVPHRNFNKYYIRYSYNVL